MNNPMEDVDPSGTTVRGSDGTKPNPDRALDDAGRALFRLGRMFDRQRVRRVLAESTGRSVELSRILAVQAVEAGLEEPGAEVTVGAVAERLEVDQSTASRLVADTIRDGFLSRTTSEADGRRSRLRLTEAGRGLAEDSRRYQRSVFEDLTRGWPEGEREQFARLLAKFADSMAEASSDTEPGVPRDES
jgi:DNA-binding MarR family transcriptional regulator